MITLGLDAAPGAGTIAVFLGDALLAERTVPMGARAGDLFFPAVLDALRAAQTRPSLVARVICGGGPGSFTSLRIAGAVAKGIAEGAGATLLVVPSLALAVAGDQTLAAGRYLVVSDALRGECFVQPCERSGAGAVTAEVAERVPAGAVTEVARRAGAMVIGFAQARAAVPHARGVLALVAGGAALAVDIATWEPAYGRLAEAQVVWEATHGRALPAA